MTKRNADIQTFKPKWPDFTLLPADQMRYTYDRPSDTLFVDFYGTARAAASVPLDRGDRDYLYLRVDPETDAVVGLQIEYFLSYVVEQHPDLAGALDVATLVDIGDDDLDRITRIRSGRAPGGDPATLIEELRRLSA
ncbi:MAG: hypothetical protein ACREX8_20030 [Gammaproteobacteria bacterium]